MNETQTHDPGRDRRRALFDRADEIPAVQWESFLERECDDDPGLRGEVLRLLRAAERAGRDRFLGPTPEPARTDEPDYLGKFQVVRRLSEENTGQAVAYLGFDTDTQRHVVIKRYHGGGDLQATSDEARALVRVSSPYVAQCYGVERIGDEACLVVEYVPGRSLAEVLREGPLDPERAIGIASQLAEGVAAVHACGLVHRDIKPANVILHEDGTPRLIDFGLAAPLGGRRLQGPSGSPPYMAPEQAKREWDRIDFRTDVYGLGGVFYAILTGLPPHEGATRAELIEHAKLGIIRPLHTIVPDLPEAIESLCMRALAPSPSQRFESARAFRQALEDYPGLPREAGSLTPPGRPGSSWPSGRAAAGLMAVVAPLILAAIFLPSIVPGPRSARPPARPEQLIQVVREDRPLPRDLRRVLPLYIGLDRFVIEAEVPRGFRPVVFAFGTEGQFYEFSEDALRVEPGHGEETLLVRYPADPTKFVPLEGKPGTLAVILVAAKDREGLAAAVRQALGSKPFSKLPAGVLVAMDADRARLEVVDEASYRNFGAPQHSTIHSVEATLDAVRLALRDRAAFITGVAVPVDWLPVGP
jgi:serine/threonine protein kinase